MSKSTTCPWCGRTKLDVDPCFCPATARIAELEGLLERAKKSVELHDFFTTYDILHEASNVSEPQNDVQAAQGGLAQTPNQ